jgi:hypothetical protein
LLYWHNPKRARREYFADTTFEKIQTIFLNRMKALSWEKQMFDVYLGDIVFSVLNETDSEYAVGSCKQMCETDENVVKLVDWILDENQLSSRRTGKAVWRFDNYYPFITADQICGAITRQKEINAIPPHLAEKCEFFLEHSSDYKEPPASDEEE